MCVLRAKDRVHVLIRVHVQLGRRHREERHGAARTLGRRMHHYDARVLMRRACRRQLHHAHELRGLLAQDGRQVRQGETLGGRRLPRRSGRGGLPDHRLAPPLLAPIDGDAEPGLALLRCGVLLRRVAASRHEILRREAHVCVGNLDRARPAESPLDGVHEDAAGLRVDTIPLCEHVEVQSLYDAAVAHLEFPVFVRTLLRSG
jgi:hypothetical protein